MIKPGVFVEQQERAKALIPARVSHEGDEGEAERRKAALYVCGRAENADDATELLLALGLLNPGFKWSQSSRNRRRRVAE